MSASAKKRNGVEERELQRELAKHRMLDPRWWEELEPELTLMVEDQKRVAPTEVQAQIAQTRYARVARLLAKKGIAL